jgi:hypothetical protein
MLVETSLPKYAFSPWHEIFDDQASCYGTCRQVSCQGMQAINFARPVAHESEQQRRLPRAIRDRGAYKGSLEPIVKLSADPVGDPRAPINPKSTHEFAPGGSIYCLHPEDLRSSLKHAR